MKFISLFAGIGGFDLGFERAGFECVAQVEIDSFCQKVLSKHWPDVPKFGDVRDVGKHNLPKADAIIGGFPCQPHSLAGKRAGAEDDRNLWPEYFRIVREIHPTWVVGENVPGIRTTILDDVLSDLESEGYSTVTLDIPAIAFNAPHRRHRYFIVANSEGGNGSLSAIARQQEEALHARGDGTSRSMAYSSSQGLPIWQTQPQASIRPVERTGMACGGEAGYWSTEPGVCRVADGVSDRVDRIRSLGNAIVPQVAEFIARSILQTETHLTKRALDERKCAAHQ